MTGILVHNLESSDDEEEADGDRFEGLFDNATNGSERTEAWVNSAGATGAVGLQAGSDVAVAETLNDDALPRPVENVLNANPTSSQVLPHLVNFPRPLNPITNLIFLKIHSRMFASMFGIKTSPNQVWLQHLLHHQLRFPRLRRSWTNSFITFSRHLLPPRTSQLLSPITRFNRKTPSRTIGEPNSTTTKVKTATKTFASASESTTRQRRQPGPMNCVLSARENTLSSDVKCFAKRLRIKEQRLLPTTSFASPASERVIMHVIVPVLELAAKTIAN